MIWSFCDSLFILSTFKFCYCNFPLCAQYDALHVLNAQHPKEEDSKEEIPDEENAEEWNSKEQHPKVQDSVEEDTKEEDSERGESGSLEQRSS